MKKSSCLHFRQILTATFLIPFLPCHGSVAPKQAWSSSTKLTNHTLGVKATHWLRHLLHYPLIGWVIFPEKYISQNCIFSKNSCYLCQGEGRGGDCLSRPLDKGGGGWSPPKIFSILRASLWCKNKGEPGLPGRSTGSGSVCFKALVVLL